jgi:hypothetical protein
VANQLECSWGPHTFIKPSQQLGNTTVVHRIGQLSGIKQVVRFSAKLATSSSSKNVKCFFDQRRALGTKPYRKAFPGGRQVQGKMEWLHPSPDGIDLCQDCGVESHTMERTARWKI